MSSKTKIALLTLNCLTIALSISILGLTARHVSFIQNTARDHSISIKYDVGSLPGPQIVPDSSTIWYLPARWTMRDTYALLVAGVLGTVLGSVVLSMSLSQGNATMWVTGAGRKVRNVQIAHLPTILVLNSLIIAVMAIGMGLAYYQYRPISAILLNPGSYTKDGLYARYSNQRHQWNFETWNCALAPLVPPSYGSFTPQGLNSLCKQAGAARIMTVPALILSVLALGLQFWAWRKHINATRQYQEAAPPYDEVAWKHADIEGQSQDSGDRSPVSPISPIAAPERMAEMPGYQMNRAELPMDATIKEMMGESGHRELDGGTVAVEKPADERHVDVKI